VRLQTIGEMGNPVIYLWADNFLSATVKELLKSDSICESYTLMTKGPVFLTHSVYRFISEIIQDRTIVTLEC